jgi:hypothetical protein
LQEERRRLGLPGAVAAVQKCGVFMWIVRVNVHDRIPAIREARQSWIQCGAEVRDQLRKWTGKVFILAASKAVSCHYDPAAKPLVCGIDRGQRFTLCEREH